MKYSPCGRKILCASEPNVGKILLINAFNGNLIETFDIKGHINDICFSPDSNYLIYALKNQINVTEI